METSLSFECPRGHIGRISFAFTQTLEAVVYSPCLHAPHLIVFRLSNIPTDGGWLPPNFMHHLTLAAIEQIW